MIEMHLTVTIERPVEEVFDFLAKLHPSWKMHGLSDKLILRLLARSVTVNTSPADVLFDPESLKTR